MNRHARRAAAAQKKGEGDKSKMVLHTNPEEVTPEHLGLFLATLMQAYEIAKKVPGIELPLHISVESGGARMCGTIGPDDGLGGDESFIVDETVH